LFSDESDEEKQTVLQKEELESELIEDIAKTVRSAFSRLK
jgi:hypothetical protein